METKSKHYHLYACLPFIELAHEASIHLGPVMFWPASRYNDFVPPHFQENFQNYIYSIGQIQTQSPSAERIQTAQLSLQSETCLSLSDQIPENQRELLIIDAVYLLYFACTFRDMYYGNEIPSFSAFSKMIPASIDFISQPDNWADLHIQETDREKTICIHLFDSQITKGLGRVLYHIYQIPHLTNPQDLDNYKRLVRSIRYLIDRFFHQFVNIVGKGLDFPENIFEPEDILFLASGFEALFHLHDQQTAADFKHKIRPLLHLTYSKPLELFWKWADDFFEVRRQIVHGGSNPDPMFKLNPNFEVSHIVIGIKLFVYSVYYMLFKYQMLSSESHDPHTPPDFKWIHPEELLLCFWTEKSLLQKLAFFFKQIQETRQPKHIADIHFLANLFVLMQEHRNSKSMTFIPTSRGEIETEAKIILDAIQRAEKEEDLLILKGLPSELSLYIEKRCLIPT